MLFTKQIYTKRAELNERIWWINRFDIIILWENSKVRKFVKNSKSIQLLLTLKYKVGFFQIYSSFIKYLQIYSIFKK